MISFTEPSNRQQQDKFSNMVLRFENLGMTFVILLMFIADIGYKYNFEYGILTSCIVTFATFILLTFNKDNPKSNIIGIVWPVLALPIIFMNGYLPISIIPIATVTVLLSYRGTYRLVLPFVFLLLCAFVVFLSDAYFDYGHTFRLFVSAAFLILPLNTVLDAQKFDLSIKRKLLTIFYFQLMVSGIFIVIANLYFDIENQALAFLCILLGLFFFVLHHFKNNNYSYTIFAWSVIVFFVIGSYINGLTTTFLYPGLFLIFFVLLRNSIAVFVSFALIALSANLFLNYESKISLQDINFIGYFVRFFMLNLVLISILSSIVEFLGSDKTNQFPSLLKITTKVLVIFIISAALIGVAHHGFDGHIKGWPNLSNYDINILSMNVMLIFTLTWLGYYFLSIFENSQLLTKKLEEQNLVLIDAMEAKDRFLAKVNHELRTPLNGILGCIQIIETHNIEDNTARFLSVLKHSGNHLLFMVEDIMDLTAVKNGKLKLVVEPVAIHEIINNSILLIQNQSIRNLDFVCNIDPLIPDKILCDNKRLTQILINLLNNAVKFTPHGSITVNCSLVDEQRFVRIDVIDTGIGIPESKLRTIFNEFEQIETGTTRSYDGLGIGLSLVADLVNLFDGYIYVESEVNIGSKFSVFIPFFKDSELANIVPVSQPEHQFKDLQVVIVDDHKVNLVVLEKLLVHEGVNVKSFDNPEESIKYIKQHMDSIDAVFTDLDMPIMDGYSLAVKIAKLKVSIPVFAVTGNLTLTSNKTSDSTFAGFMTKPINKKLLQKYLSSLVK